MGQSILLLLEFADAGDLSKLAVDRFPGGKVPEPAARFFVLQVYAGLRHLHKRHIVHNDVHARNILLKVDQREGNRLRCLIADFGLATIIPVSERQKLGHKFREDVSKFVRMILVLVTAARGLFKLAQRPVSKEFVDLMITVLERHEYTDEIDDLQSFKWFFGELQPVTGDPVLTIRNPDSLTPLSSSERSPSAEAVVEFGPHSLSTAEQQDVRTRSVRELFAACLTGTRGARGAAAEVRDRFSQRMQGLNCFRPTHHQRHREEPTIRFRRDRE